MLAIIITPNIIITIMDKQRSIEMGRGRCGLPLQGGGKSRKHPCGRAWRPSVCPSHSVTIQVGKPRPRVGQRCSAPAPLPTKPLCSGRDPGTEEGSSREAGILTDMVAAPGRCSQGLLKAWAQDRTSWPSLYSRILHINSLKAINGDFGPFCRVSLHGHLPVPRTNR